MCMCVRAHVCACARVRAHVCVRVRARARSRLCMREFGREGGGRVVSPALKLVSNIVFLNHPKSFLDSQNMFRLRLYLLLLFCFECLTDNVD